MSRPRGDIALALVTSARALVQRSPDGGMRGPTLVELAGHAQVGYDAALSRVKYLSRTGELRCISGRRKVPYRNKPVAEYLPREVATEVAPAEPAGPDFDALLTVWK